MTFWKLNSRLFHPNFIVSLAYFLLGTFLRVQTECGLSHFHANSPECLSLSDSISCDPSWSATANLVVGYPRPFTSSVLYFLSSNFLSFLLEAVIQERKRVNLNGWSLLFDCRLKLAVEFLFLHWTYDFGYWLSDSHWKLSWNMNYGERAPIWRALDSSNPENTHQWLCGCACWAGKGSRITMSFLTQQSSSNCLSTKIRCGWQVFLASWICSWREQIRSGWEKAGFCVRKIK